MDAQELMKKAENEHKNKIELLEKNVADLKKQKENFSLDVDASRKAKTGLEAEVKKLKETISIAIGEALKAEKASLLDKNDEVDSIKSTLQAERVKVSDQAADGEKKAKETKKLQEALEKLKKEQEIVNKEADDYKGKLENIMDIIREIVK